MAARRGVSDRPAIPAATHVNDIALGRLVTGDLSGFGSVQNHFIQVEPLSARGTKTSQLGVSAVRCKDLRILGAAVNRHIMSRSSFNASLPFFVKDCEDTS